MIGTLLVAGGVIWVVARGTRRALSSSTESIPSPSTAPASSPSATSAPTDSAPPSPAGLAVDPALADEQARRNLAMSTAATGLLVAARLGPTVLFVPGAALGLLSTGLLCRGYIKQIRAAGPMTSGLVDLLGATGAIVAGYWIPACAGIALSSGAYLLSRRTERDSREDFVDLFDRQARTAWKQVGDDEFEVPLECVACGDHVVVDAGNPVPVDGVVVSGLALVDEQSMTGEARPIEKVSGAEVMASTVVLEGRLVIEVLRSGRDTLAGELVNLLADVDRARQDGRSRAQDMIERLVPPTLIGAGVATVAYGPLGGLAILWTGIGYPLRLAGPTAVIHHVRRASSHGILVRDGRALERLADVDVVIFDKTGTLTLGTPRLSRVRAVAPWAPIDLLRIAATLESRQGHPIAKAIREAADALGLLRGTPETLSVLPGLGLEARFEGRDVLVGSARLMASRDVRLPAGWQTMEDADDDMQVYVALDGRFAGAIALAPGIRPEARSVIDSIRSAGVEVFALSGDRERPTRRLADVLELDGYAAELMPDDKAARIRRLQAQGKRVCFVGDGINDVLALRTADVSVSLRGAAGIAESTASLLLLDGDLRAIPTLFDLARRMRGNLDRSARITVASGALGAAGVLAHVLALPQVAAIYFLALGSTMANALSPIRSGIAGTEAEPRGEAPGPLFEVLTVDEAGRLERHARMPANSVAGQVRSAQGTCSSVDGMSAV